MGPLRHAVGISDGTATWKTDCQLLKILSYHTIQQFPLRFTTKRTENLSTKTLYRNTHSGIIHYSQEAEAIQMPIS